MALKNINKFIDDYAYNFSANEDRVKFRIKDAQKEDPKLFKEIITKYNKKVKKNIATIKADAKKYKKKGIFYNEKGLLEDQYYYKLDGTRKK
tara:strand:+ start:19 stop:294 length:276 start_codon:yes stop_codon:yes gene_type:complete